MKKIANKRTEVSDGQDNKATYADFVKACANNQIQQGFSVQDIRDRLRIVEAVEKADGEIKLEDADFENLKQYVQNMRWAIVHPDILEFCDYITGL